MRPGHLVLSMQKVFLSAPSLLVPSLLLLAGLFLPSGRLSAQTLDLHEFVDRGYRVHFAEGGKGPAVLLVHGLGVARWSFLKLAEHMASHGYHVLLPDIPGQGDTERSEKRNYSMPSQADYLERFLVSRKLKKVLVVGNSMGGHVAVSLALRHPRSVSKLVLISPSGMQAAGIQPYMELMIPEEADDEKKIDLTWNNRVRKDIRRGAHFPVERVLARLKTRTLILWGSKDEILPVALAEEWKKRVPRARLVVLDGLGHIAQEDDPVAVFGEIENFVSH